MSPETARTLIRIGLIVTIPALVGWTTLVVLQSAVLSSKNPDQKVPVLFEVAPGKSLKDIGDELEQKGLIKHSWSIRLLARLKRIDSTKISAGEYEISAATTPEEILRKLVTFDVYKRKITVKEGATIKDISQLLEEAGIVTKREFEQAASDPELLKIANIFSTSFEGYLFPETYFFSRPITARQIIFAMMEEGEKKHWPPYFTDQLEKLGMSRHEILTLASIIEKESGNVAEQPLISAVFHNRLRVGMKLQADPTVIYGLASFNGNLTKEHLLTPSPYNTYLNYGLPPGPICNPGESAIRAALFPQAEPFLYFVASGDGKHVFSKTLEEHNAAVNLYQRRIGKRPAATPAPAPAAKADAQATLPAAGGSADTAPKSDAATQQTTQYPPGFATAKPKNTPITAGPS